MLGNYHISRNFRPQVTDRPVHTIDKEVILGNVLPRPYTLSTVVSQMEHARFYTEPSIQSLIGDKAFLNGQWMWQDVPSKVACQSNRDMSVMVHDLAGCILRLVIGLTYVLPLAGRPTVAMAIRPE